MDHRRNEVERIQQALTLLREEFPHLRVFEDWSRGDDEVWITIPPQPGLGFEIGMGFQSRDELNLSVGAHFWVEWYPCGDADVFRRYIMAVRGVLSGEFRIVESSIFGKTVGAELQRPLARHEWQHVAGWANLGCLLPLPRSRHIVQNTRITKSGAQEVKT
jgi:hypothetical protein